MSLSVSVLICTLDREGPLRQALEGLARLDEPPADIVVVNGPSFDGTARLLESYGDRVVSAICPDANLSHARNIGLSLCSGEAIALLDDDAVPHASWIRRLSARFADPDLAAVGGYTVGRGGWGFQARKIVCDRYGDARLMGELFDERPLNQPGSFAFPAPMGTNIAFRREALEDIGGFDENFAYFLDETDVCLRLVDAGWHISFEPSALVWHQFVESRLRDGRSVPRELLTLSKSKSYFVHRHGMGDGRPGERAAAYANLEAFRRDKLDYLGRLAKDGALADSTAARLAQEIEDGLDAGAKAAAARASPRKGDWSPGSSPVPRAAHHGPPRLTIAFACRSYPPRSEAGIARWTSLAAEGLARRGHSVHVIAEADGRESLSFRDGVWLHQVIPATDGFADISARTGAPAHVASWAATLRAHLPVLEAFAVEALSFPIWDAEGVACIGQTDIPIVVSLHTTSALVGAPAAELLARGTGDVAGAEKIALAGANLVVANSHAALTDIARTSGVEFAARAVIVPHGAPSAAEPATIGRKPRLRVLFVGRNETRKGAHVALAAVARAISLGADVEASFVGAGCEALTLDPVWNDQALAGRLVAHGHVVREQLDLLYRDHDVLLMPSGYESFGLVAIEAMAQGLPVLATAVGGLVEVVTDGVDGFLVTPDDGAAQQLAARVTELNADRARLIAMGAQAFENARARFGVETMCLRLEEAFLGLARRAARSAS